MNTTSIKLADSKRYLEQFELRNMIWYAAASIPKATLKRVFKPLENYYKFLQITVIYEYHLCYK